jgi:hypothetical protein
MKSEHNLYRPVYTHARQRRNFVLAELYIFLVSTHRNKSVFVYANEGRAVTRQLMRVTFMRPETVLYYP